MRLSYRLLIVAGVAAFIAGLFLYDMMPSGRREYVVDFVSYYPFVSKPYPLGRVGERVDGYVAVAAEPLYVDVRVPRNMQRAQVTVRYRGNAPLRIGVRVAAAGEWAYAIHELDVREDGDARVGSVMLPLDRAVIENGRVRLIFSSPDLQPGTLGLDELRIALEGRPLVEAIRDRLW